MDLVCIYRGTGPTDATLVAHWLERNGITAHVQGDLLGLRGEIPVGDAWPTVWVRKPDQGRAEDAVKVFEGPTLVHPTWRCARCGEDNEPNFGSCWSCEADRPDVAAAQR
jgi:hypothetical protein